MVLPSFTGFNLVLLGFTRFFGGLLCSVLGVGSIYRVLMGSIDFQWVLMGSGDRFYGLHWFSMVFNG